jgi:hypothetical protein
MKVVFKGETIKNPNNVAVLIEEVLNTMAERIGVPDGTTVELEGVEFKAVFIMDGEKRYATVPRTINGIETDEIFTVEVTIGEDQRIVTEVDNEEESFYDGYTLANAIGVEYEYEGIESAYSNDDLEVIDSIGENTDSDVMAVTYRIKETGQYLSRMYKGNLLVSERVYDAEAKTILEDESENSIVGLDLQHTKDAEMARNTVVLD